MSDIDIANEFSFGTALTPDQVEQLPKFNLARGKIIPIQLSGDFTETWDPGNFPSTPPKATNDSNYGLYITNYPTPFFIISSSQVYNINKVSSMPYNDPRNGKNSDTTTVLQYTVVQGDESNYEQQYGTTESATINAGGNGQVARNFYFTPFQGQITQSMVPVYLLPIKTTVKDNPSNDGSNTYLYTFVRADIFITDTSATTTGVGSGFSYIDYLKNPQNYANLIQPSNLPNYTNLPDPYSFPYTGSYIYVKNLVFLATNYIGNSASVNSHASFCRFLTYDDMYNITASGVNFSQGNSAGPVFFGLNDLPFKNASKTIPAPYPSPSTLYPGYPYGNDSIPPYYIFSGRPYSIFFGLHLNTNTFKTSGAIYGGNFNNYAKNTDSGITLPSNAKGYPVNFLTSLGNNNPTNGAPNTSSNNTSYVKVFNANSTTTESFYQSNISNYIGSTYDMDEYYIANSRTAPDYGFSGASSFFNIYKFSLNKYIRFYSGTDNYPAREIPYDTTNTLCTYNGSAYNGYMPNIPNGEPNYDLLNCNVTQAGLVQNMTLQFVPLNYFVPPALNVVPNVTDISMAIPIGLQPTDLTDTIYINNSTIAPSGNYTVSHTDTGLTTYTQVNYQIVGGGGGGGGGGDRGSSRNNTGGGGGGSGYIVGYVGGIYTDSDGNTSNYNLKIYPKIETFILPAEWEIDISLGAGGTLGGEGNPGGDGGSTTITIKDVSPNPDTTKFPKTFTAYGGKGGTGGSTSSGNDGNGNGGDGFNGGGGGANGFTASLGSIGGGDTLNGGKDGLSSGDADTSGDGGGTGAGIGTGTGPNFSSAGGGAGAGSGVTVSNKSYTGGIGGTGDGDGKNGGNGVDYTGGGGGGGAYSSGNTPFDAGNGGRGYAILQFGSPISNQFKFPNANNAPVANIFPYPSTLPNVNSSNNINPVELFKNISSLYANTSSIVCGNILEPSSKCGFVPTEYYNSLNRYFYTEAPDLPSGAPNCNTLTGGDGKQYDPPIIVDQVGGINVYNSQSCGVTSDIQNLCVPNFKYLSNQLSENPFKCIPIPYPDTGLNVEYIYENYYGMYEEDTTGTTSVPININFPKYFIQTPNKNVTSTLPDYTPTPYPKPINVPGSTKEKSFWNSTLFIVLAIVIAVTILIVIIILVVKFSKKPEPYESARIRYVS
jgi:hypothetical protein